MILFLRNFSGGFFMENLLWMAGESIKKNSSFSMPNLHYPMVDTRDIGRSAAVCLGSNDPKHFGKNYELSGPENLTCDQIAKILTNVLGRSVQYNELPMDQFKKHAPQYVSEIFEFLHENGKNAAPFTQDVKQITGQHTALEQFLSDHKNFL